MLRLDNLTKHRGLNYSEEVRKICEPLNTSFGISYFHFFKIYTNDRLICLCTHPNHVENIFRRFCNEPLIELPPYTENNYQLWDLCDPESNIFINAKKYFSLFHFISLIKKLSNFNYEVYHFATGKENPNMNQFYLNNTAILNHFICYFKYKAEKLIKIVENDKIFHKNIISISPDYHSYFNKSTKFINRFSVKKYYINVANAELCLSACEYKILQYFLKGLSSKEIAILMSRSYRTIEGHIANIKNKLNCHEKSSLRKILLDNDIFN